MIRQSDLVFQSSMRIMKEGFYNQTDSFHMVRSVLKNSQKDSFHFFEGFYCQTASFPLSEGFYGQIDRFSYCSKVSISRQLVFIWSEGFYGQTFIFSKSLQAGKSLYMKWHSCCKRMCPFPLYTVKKIKCGRDFVYSFLKSLLHFISFPCQAQHTTISLARRLCLMAAGYKKSFVALLMG